MKIQNLVLIFILFAIISCSSDDDDDRVEVEVRDVEEVKAENMEQIETFLETHYFELVDNPQNPNFQNIVFEEIGENDTDKQAVMDSEFLKSKTVNQQDVDYTLYYLQIREGAESVRKPTFADSVLVTYNGFALLDQEVFDASPNPIWFDLTNNIRGFYEVMDEFRGSTGFQENSDGTVSFNDDFGIGSVFIPSGIAYFASPPTGSGISAYEPIVFNIQLYRSKESDHDRDGVPTWREDLNDNRRVTDDNTDDDQIPNYADTDDDGDGVPTRDEIDFDENDEDDQPKSPHSARMLYLGLGAIVFVPIFKTVTHLPPYVGMMLSLAVVATFAEIYSNSKFSISSIEGDQADEHAEHASHSPVHASLSKIEMPSILFFLGILMAVAALESLGILFNFADSLKQGIPLIGTELDGTVVSDLVVILLGIGSAVIDNVPLVAASLGMFSEPLDNPLWHFIAFSAGTGGSMLIIGSAAGVVAMGMEKIDFFWYLKKISWLALVGFLIGSASFVIIRMFI